MTKEEHIEYWVKTAALDWPSVETLFESKNYLQALYWAHLVLEKLLKAHWIKDNDSNTPPKIHALHILLKNTKLDLTEEERDFVRIFNDFQIESRYPDERLLIYKRCTKEYSQEKFEQVKELRKCLLNKLP